uniref:hypothetical protein n=1 Tax=Oculatella sp. LEGE 06141 TaxID=1828648 RepID=UPI0030DB7E96
MSMQLLECHLDPMNDIKSVMNATLALKAFVGPKVASLQRSATRSLKHLSSKQSN